jgi:hypothetical protein
VEDHFVGSDQMVEIGNSGQRAVLFGVRMLG